MRGFLSAALVLVALQAALSSDEATTRVGKLVGQVADLSRRLIDPSVAAIPDLSAGGAPPGTGGQAGPPAVQRQQAGGGQQQQDDQADEDNSWLPWTIPPGML